MVNILCALETETVLQVMGGLYIFVYILCMSIILSWLLVLFKSSIYLMIPCLFFHQNRKNRERGMLLREG